MLTFFLAAGEIIKLAKQYGAYVIHKCTAVRHAKSAQKAGADMLSIDGCELPPRVHHICRH
jgi:NADH:quinone reductase (non-electrogenic)